MGSHNIRVIWALVGGPSCIGVDCHESPPATSRQKGPRMTPKQRIEVRMSECRERLNEVAALEGDDFTSEIKGEVATLSSEYQDLESRHRASIIAEGATEMAAVGAFADGTTDQDGAEVRSLIQKVNLGDYLRAAAAGIGLGGAAAELNAALEVPTVGGGGGIAVPWRVLLGDAGLPEVRQSGQGAEVRAFTDTGDYAGGVAQRPILQRLFGSNIMDALGVRIDTVPAGRTEWPLITAGIVPDQQPEGTAADHPGRGDVRQRGVEAEAVDRSVRVHTRTGGAGQRPGACVCAATWPTPCPPR